MDPNTSIDDSLLNSKIIENIENTLIDLKLQHNALVNTTSVKSDLLDKIPGVSFINSAYNKLYKSWLVKHPDSYKVKLFDIPTTNTTAPANGGGKRLTRKPKRKGGRKSRKH